MVKYGNLGKEKAVEHDYIRAGVVESATHLWGLVNLGFDKTKATEGFPWKKLAPIISRSIFFMSKAPRIIIRKTAQRGMANNLTFCHHQ